MCAFNTAKMAPTQYARTVRCIDEVMCYCVWYGKVRYGTIRFRTVRYCTFTVRTENLEILERGEADPI